jgi:epoxyqueuosine reductase
MLFEEQIKARAKELGFDLTGIAPVTPVPELSFYTSWIEAGFAGKMDYLKRNIDKRQNITRIVPEAKSIIVSAMIYNTGQPLSIHSGDAGKGWISRYSWGDDYHDIIKAKLFELSDYIAANCGTEYVNRLYVDTGPVVDRVHAKYAGIGWFGKNTCIINQKAGSWFFLGEIITNLDLKPDTPVPDRCGSCQRCIDDCPTEAILEPYVLDSRRCISYLTIELKEKIPVALRENIGNHIFGCDICQDVCPWNRKAPVTDKSAFEPRPGLMNPSLETLADLNDDGFREKFRQSPVKRTKLRGILRNLAVVMGNTGSRKYLPVLQSMAEKSETMVAEHARWAINKIKENNPV